MRELLECLLGISPSGRNPCGGNNPSSFYFARAWNHYNSIFPIKTELMEYFFETTTKILI